MACVRASTHQTASERQPAADSSYQTFIGLAVCSFNGASHFAKPEFRPPDAEKGALADALPG